MFRFKQFEVNDAACAQKVGTDGVLLGAWTPLPQSVHHLLDIGTGSGLIALMLAQRTQNSYVSIDAIDIDEQAVLQAANNFKNSLWHSHLNAYHASLQQFETITTYDVIVSNPPYFDNALKSKIHHRNLARHNDSLSLKDLFFHAVNRLNKDGIFSIIYPYNSLSLIMELALQCHIQPIAITNVKGNKETPYKRVLAAFVKNEIKVNLLEKELIIEESRNHYTEAFKKITQDFYLKF